MEDAININEYVRTEDGNIGKIEQINKEPTDDNIIYVVTDNWVGMYEEIVKHSPNIIDLIEKNDIGIMSYNGVIFSKFITEDDIIELKIGTYKLLQIATKEQFENIKYKIGE